MAHLGGIDADLRQRERGDALALGSDDSLEVGVAGLVDLVRHRHDCGQGASTVSECVSASRRAVTRPPSTSSAEANVTCGKPQPLGELRRHEGGFAVGGRHAGEDQVHRAVRAKVADRCRERQGRRGRVRTGQRVVA